MTDALAASEGRARLMVKAMAVAERVGTRFYSLRQVRPECNAFYAEQVGLCYLSLKRQFARVAITV